MSELTLVERIAKLEALMETTLRKLVDLEEHMKQDRNIHVHVEHEYGRSSGSVI